MAPVLLTVANFTCTLWDNATMFFIEKYCFVPYRTRRTGLRKWHESTRRRTCKKDNRKRTSASGRKAERTKKEKEKKESIWKVKRVRLDPFLLPPAIVVSFVRLQPMLLTLAWLSIYHDLVARTLLGRKLNPATWGHLALYATKILQRLRRMPTRIVIGHRGQARKKPRNGHRALLGGYLGLGKQNGMRKASLT